MVDNHKTVLEVYSKFNELVKSDNVITDESGIIVDLMNRFGSNNLAQKIEAESYKFWVSKRKIPKIRNDLLGGQKYSHHYKSRLPRAKEDSIEIEVLYGENLKELVLEDLWMQLFKAAPNRLKSLSKENITNLEKYMFIPAGMRIRHQELINNEGIKLESMPYTVITDKIYNLLDFIIKYPRFSPFKTN